MAKEEVHTIALVNKKQGDVTFIVDKSFYLGNGRDIEMSVPSTKTYTCHLIMGYILSEKILNLIDKEVMKILYPRVKKLLIQILLIKNLIQ